MGEKLRLSSLIAPTFVPIHNAILKDRYSHYWLGGGRASGKSSFVSIEIIQGMMRDKSANAIVYRRFGNTLADSVVAQLMWAITSLNVGNFWQLKRSPYELVYRPTGQRILFRGGDDGEKSKGLKLSSGHWRYIWFEELTEFEGIDDVETILRSLMRGEGKCVVLYTYNPPKSRNNWVNSEARQIKPGRLAHTSTYLDLPPEWLGPQFIAEAETTRATNEMRYRWAYLGEATGEGGQVFDNIILRTITAEERDVMDRYRRGIDWGFAADPFAYNVCHYDKTRRRLYLLREIHEYGIANRTAAARIWKEAGNGLITCDSAEPKSIADMRAYGLNVRGARKGPDSVEYGIKWLQDLDEVVIDPSTCPETAREFSEYELERDRLGNYKNGYPDKDNHHIDAVRYACEDDMHRGGLKLYGGR